MKKILWGLVIGLVLTVFFMYPLLTKSTTHLSSRQDGILVAWLINWGSDSLIYNKPFFDAPFFHPYENTIAYSDPFFSTALLNVPIKALTATVLTNPLEISIFNHNIHLVLGSVLTFLGVYLLARELFTLTSIGIFTALIFSFSHMHLDYMAHLHVFLVAGIPFYFFFLFRFFKTKKEIYLILTALAFLYQLLNSAMSGYFIVLMTFVSLLNKEFRDHVLLNMKRALPYLFGIALMSIFFYWPYIQVKNQFNYVRTIRDAAHFSFSLNRLFTLEIMVFFSLFFIFLQKSWTRIKNTLNKKEAVFFIYMLLGLIFMLGPVLKLDDQTIKLFGLPIPLPYALSYYLIPGFKAFRATSRWIIVFNFGLALSLGYLLLLAKIKSKYIYVLSLTIGLLLWLTQVPHLKIFHIPTEIPEIYNVIQQRPESVLAEFPLYVWSNTYMYYREADRLLYQQFHQKKLYNGFSGFAPPEREYLWDTISDNLNSEEIYSHLKASGVELVLLHINEKSSYQNFNSLYYNLITCSAQSCLYTIR